MSLQPDLFKPPQHTIVTLPTPMAKTSIDHPDFMENKEFDGTIPKSMTLSENLYDPRYLSCALRYWMIHSRVHGALEQVNEITIEMIRGHHIMKWWNTMCDASQNPGDPAALKWFMDSVAVFSKSMERAYKDRPSLVSRKKPSIYKDQGDEDTKEKDTSEKWMIPDRFIINNTKALKEIFSLAHQLLTRQSAISHAHVHAATLATEFAEQIAFPKLEEYKKIVVSEIKKKKKSTKRKDTAEDVDEEVKKEEEEDEEYGLEHAFSFAENQFNDHMFSLELAEYNEGLSNLYMQQKEHTTEKKSSRYKKRFERMMAAMEKKTAVRSSDSSSSSSSSSHQLPPLSPLDEGVMSDEDDDDLIEKLKKKKSFGSSSSSSSSSSTTLSYADREKEIIRLQEKNRIKKQLVTNLEADNVLLGLDINTSLGNAASRERRYKRIMSIKSVLAWAHVLYETGVQIQSNDQLCALQIRIRIFGIMQGVIEKMKKRKEIGDLGAQYMYSVLNIRGENGFDRFGCYRVRFFYVVLLLACPAMFNWFRVDRPPPSTIIGSDGTLKYHGFNYFTDANDDLNPEASNELLSQLEITRDAPDIATLISRVRTFTPSRKIMILPDMKNYITLDGKAAANAARPVKISTGGRKKKVMESVSNKREDGDTDDDEDSNDDGDENNSDASGNDDDDDEDDDDNLRGKTKKKKKKNHNNKKQKNASKKNKVKSSNKEGKTSNRISNPIDSDDDKDEEDKKTTMKIKKPSGRNAVKIRNPHAELVSEATSRGSLAWTQIPTFFPEHSHGPASPLESETNAFEFSEKYTRNITESMLWNSPFQVYYTAYMKSIYDLPIPLKQMRTKAIRFNQWVGKKHNMESSRKDSASAAAVPATSGLAYFVGFHIPTKEEKQKNALEAKKEKQQLAQAKKRNKLNREQKGNKKKNNQKGKGKKNQKNKKKASSPSSEEDGDNHDDNDDDDDDVEEKPTKTRTSKKESEKKKKKKYHDYRKEDFKEKRW